LLPSVKIKNTRATALYRIAKREIVCQSQNKNLSGFNRKDFYEMYSNLFSMPVNQAEINQEAAFFLKA